MSRSHPATPSPKPEFARVHPEVLTDNTVVYNVHVTADGVTLILAALSRQHAIETADLINECAYVARAPVEV